MGKRMLSGLIVLFFTLSAVNAQHQDFMFDHLNIDGGLSNNTVYSITRDHLGFMWFATNDGLSRYDGYDYTIYRHIREDSTSISNNKVYHVFEDSDLNVWVATNSGLNRYNRTYDHFERFYHDPENHLSISHNSVRTIYEDSAGTLWFGTLGGGLNKFDKHTGHFTRYNFPDRNIWSVLEDTDGNFWVGTGAPGLVLFDRKLHEFNFYPFPKEKKVTLKPFTGKTIFEDHQGQLWICTEGSGLYLFDTSSKDFTAHYFSAGAKGLNSNIISDIIQYSDDVLWIGTDGGGINAFNTSDNTFSYIRNNVSDTRSLSGNAIYSLYRDQDGIVWIGTFGEGINVLNPHQQEFRLFTQKGTSNATLSHKSVLSFHEDRRGRIWVGTDGGGLNAFDPEKGSFVHYKHDPGDLQSISSNVVTSILEDKKGRMWVGTFAGGLNRFDPRTNTFSRFLYNADDPGSIGSNNVWNLLADGDEAIWVGTLDGLERFNLTSQTFDKIPTTIIMENPYPVRILSLFEDSRGNIWVGSSGVAILDKQTLTYAFIQDSTGLSATLFEYDIRGFHEDAQGNMWIASEGAGLFRYNPNKHELVNFSQKDGLPSDAIHQIIEDGQGHLWLSTNKGISRFDPADMSFRNYDVHDGLQSNQFAYAASLVSSSGEIYFGGVNGYNVFHPERIGENRQPPRVFITDFLLFNKPVDIGAEDSPLKEHISQTKEIKLPYRSVFTFRFTAINYIATGKNQYRYKLEGFDDWNDVGDQRMATYTNIDPGKYVFRVIASNNDGLWNEEGASVTITIMPPFWRTTWAYALFFMAFATLFYFIVRFVLNRQTYKHDLMIKDLEKAKIEEMNQMKLRFFTNIAHEFRTPLTLILGPLDKLMTSESELTPPLKKQLNIMGRNAGRLLRLINELMEFRKMEMGKAKLRLVYADLVTFINDVKSVFDEHARQHSIRFVFDPDREIVETWFDKEKLEKVIYNILSNAFKFTNDCGEITVALRTHNDSERFAHNGLKTGFVEIIISDNGIGVSERDQPRIFDRFYQVKGKDIPERSAGIAGTGIGLALAKELIEFHKGEIRVESKMGRGTTFFVSLPLGKAHFDADTFVELPTDDYVYLYSAGVYGIPPEVESEHAFSAQTPAGAKGCDKKPVMLFVDDNIDMRNYIKSSLESQFLIHVAADGLKGLEKAASIMPDVIVSDVMMPEMDGITMCTKLKTDVHTSHIPVILLTAKTSDDNTIEGLVAGADDYIPKPFNPKVLNTRINSILAIRQQLRDKFRKEGILQPSEVSVTSADEQFLQRAMETVERHIGNSEFRVSTFVDEMNMSRSVLYRKFEALTGQSVNEFVRNTRLKRAAQLLVLNEFTVSEITYEVGFSDPQYFSKCFSKSYGMTPSEYARQHVKK